MADDVMSILVRNISVLIDRLLANANSYVGVGSPEGAFAAPIGSHWHRTDGGAGTSFYVKEAGSGATGWVAK